MGARLTTVGAPLRRNIATPVLDLRLNALRDPATAIQAVQASPVFLWVTGDGGTPTVGPALTVTGSPANVSSPYSDADGNDINILDLDGTDDWIQQTTGDLDPGANDAVVLSMLIETPADVSAQKTIHAQRDVLGGRGFQCVTSGGNFIVTVVGDTTRALSAGVDASTLYHVTVIIGRGGDTMSLYFNGVQVDTDTSPVGDITNDIPFTMCAKSNGATRWAGKLLWMVEWQGVGLGTTWLANDAERVQELNRVALGVDAKNSETDPLFRCATSRAWTDHNSTAWTVSANYPRCGNTDGLTIDVDGAVGEEPEALWSGRHCVGVSGTYPRVVGTQSPISLTEASAVQPPTSIWILAGQSNARGNAFVRSELSAGYEIPRGDVLELHYLDDDGSPGAPYRPDWPEPLNAPGDLATRNIGVEPTMCIDLAAGGSRIMLVKAVRGSSALATVWDPDRGETTPAMYDPMIATAKRARVLTQAPIAGMVWIQGEADATNMDMALAYEDNLAAFIARARADLGVPAMPVMVCRLRAASPLTYAATVIGAQNSVIGGDANVHLIDTDAIAAQGDGIHFTDAGYEALGSDIATAILGL